MLWNWHETAANIHDGINSIDELTPDFDEPVNGKPDVSRTKYFEFIRVKRRKKK